MLVRMIYEKGPFPILLVLLITGGFLAFLSIYGVGSSDLDQLLASHWALGWTTENGRITLGLAVLMIILLGVLARSLSGRIKLVSRSGNLQVLMMMVVVLAQPEALFRVDVLISAVLFQLMFLIIVSTYKEESPLSELFHIGICLGLTALFVGQSVLILAAIYFSLFVIRQGSWREWIIPIIGVLMVAILLSLVLVWTSDPVSEFRQLIASAWISDRADHPFRTGTIILAAAFIPAALQLFSSITAGTVTERNYSLVLFAWILVTGSMCLLVGLSWSMALVLAAFPLSTYVARWMLSIKRWWLADMVLLAILSAPILNILWPT